MNQIEVLIIELAAVDGLTTGAIPLGKVATLHRMRACAQFEWGVRDCAGDAAQAGARVQCGPARHGSALAASVADMRHRTWHPRQSNCAARAGSIPVLADAKQNSMQPLHAFGQEAFSV